MSYNYTRSAVQFQILMLQCVNTTHLYWPSYLDNLFILLCCVLCLGCFWLRIVSYGFSASLKVFLDQYSRVIVNLVLSLLATCTHHCSR